MMMLIHDKHAGWITTCDECNPRNIWGGVCPFCDGSRGMWDATITDFDGETVRLTDGTVGMIVCTGQYVGLIDANDNERAAPDVADIAAVLELVS